MTIVNQGDKKVIPNYIKTWKPLACPIDGLKTDVSRHSNK